MGPLAVFRRAMRGAAVAVEAVTGVILAAQVAVLTYSAVQGIFGWKGQVLWLTEAAEHGLIQLAFLGAALALRAGAHQGIDVLTRLLPRRLAAAVAAANWLVIAAFGCVFAHRGVLYVVASFQVRARFASAPVPTWPFYLCYPLAGVLFALFAVEKLLGPGPPPGASPGAGAEGRR